MDKPPIRLAGIAKRKQWYNEGLVDHEINRYIDGLERVIRNLQTQLDFAARTLGGGVPDIVEIKPDEQV